MWTDRISVLGVRIKSTENGSPSQLRQGSDDWVWVNPLTMLDLRFSTQPMKRLDKSVLNVSDNSKIWLLLFLFLIRKGSSIINFTIRTWLIHLYQLTNSWDYGMALNSYIHLEGKNDLQPKTTFKNSSQGAPGWLRW